MDVEPLRQPGVLVAAVVVDYQVQIELLENLFVDPSQEAQELLVPVTGLQFGWWVRGGCSHSSSPPRSPGPWVSSGCVLSRA